MEAEVFSAFRVVCIARWLAYLIQQLRVAAFKGREVVTIFD
jgi:hypothetical protein